MHRDNFFILKKTIFCLLWHFELYNMFLCNLCISLFATLFFPVRALVYSTQVRWLGQVAPSLPGWLRFQPPAGVWNSWWVAARPAMFPWQDPWARALCEPWTPNTPAILQRSSDTAIQRSFSDPPAILQRGERRGVQISVNSVTQRFLHQTVLDLVEEESNVVRKVGTSDSRNTSHHWVATRERRLDNDNLQNRKSTIKQVISGISQRLEATWEFLSIAEGWDTFLAVWVYAGGRRWVPIGVTHSI